MGKKKQELKGVGITEHVDYKGERRAMGWWD